MKCVVKDRPDVGTSLYGFLPTAQVHSIREKLNSLRDRAVITFRSDDPAATEIIGRDGSGRIKGVLRREIAIWDGATLKFAGPILRCPIDIGSGLVEMHVGGPGAYFEGWDFGDAERDNLFVDGGCEASGLPAWTAGGGATLTRSTTHVNEGTYAAKIVGAGGYMQQVFDFYHEHIDGIEPRIAGYVKRPAASSQPALGLLVQMEADDNPGAVSNLIRSTIPADEFKRVPFGLGRPLPPFIHHSVTARFYGVGTGGLWWDSLQAGQPQSIGALAGGSDVASVLALLVAHGQLTKNDIGLLVDVTPSGNIVTDLVWQDAKHENYPDAFDQCTRRADGCEYRLDNSIRTIEIAGTVGERKPEWTLRTGIHITDGAVILDGLPVKTAAVRAIAAGGDFLLEEGGYFDAAALDGLVRDDFDRAPVSAPVRELVPLARGAVEAANRCVEDYDLEATLPIDSGVRPGDTLPAVLASGAFEAAVELRVLEVEHRPAEGRMVLGLAVAA